MGFIRWQEFNAKSFALAKRTNKPILLAIMSPWSHDWQTMDRLCFHDTGIAKRIHEKFIPILVDMLKRPDINARYNMGGIPTTCILNSNGLVVIGATYITPEEMFIFLSNGLNKYTSARTQQKEFNPVSIVNRLYDVDYLDELSHAFDSKYGGFGTSPKHLNITALNFLLESRDSRAKVMLFKTLDIMPLGEIYDDKEGGFYRHSAQQDWGDPQYEKLLEDNAGLAHLYLKAFEITKKPLYKETAKQILEFCSKLCEDGMFYGSADIDAMAMKLPASKRPKFYVKIDKTVYIPSQANAVIAYLTAYSVLKDKKSLAIAKEAMSFLMKCKIKEFFGHYYDSKINLPCLAIDQIMAIEAMLAMYEVLKDSKYLKMAQKHAEIVMKKFGTNGINDIITENAGALVKPRINLDENSRFATILFKLSRYTKKESYKKDAEKMLLAVSSQSIGAGIYAASYARALLWRKMK